MRILNHICRYFVILNIATTPLYSYADEDLIVQTSSGVTIGDKDSGVVTWHDIPYAEAPIGRLRWMAPRSFKNENYKIKNIFNNFCIQRPSSLGGADGSGSVVGREDCLYMDIRKPLKANEKIPVMFWIHGGGNTSGLKDIYDFSGLVKKENVIVVSINYRLGPFGWFSHPAIQGYQEGIDKTSNYGLLDIIKALEWVNLNIEKFGGDKNNITIFGESAGGHNVFSLLVAPQAKGLFHKAISQSGYTTSINYEYAYNTKHSSVDYVGSQEIIAKHVNSSNLKNVREVIKSMDAYKFYAKYPKDPLREIPLMTNDGIVIPSIGILESLKDPIYASIPIMAGSNRDEVKLWIGTSLYFVKPEYSFLGSIFNIPRIKMVNEDAFEAFNYYRSSAWQIRGVKEPLEKLLSAGSENIYAYRFDWDDHRKGPIANFKKIIGAAHATEIPLIAGNNKLVGNYGFLIYPRGFSKRYTSKNMMKFWANFAREGAPGSSTNGINWVKYSAKQPSNMMVIDEKKKLKIKNMPNTYKSLLKELEIDERVNEKEKCVILYQMGTLIGNDIYDDLKNLYTKKCYKNSSIQFLKDNASFISY